MSTKKLNISKADIHPVIFIIVIFGLGFLFCFIVACNQEISKELYHELNQTYEVRDQETKNLIKKYSRDGKITYREYNIIRNFDIDKSNEETKKEFFEKINEGKSLNGNNIRKQEE